MSKGREKNTHNPPNNTRVISTDSNTFSSRASAFELWKAKNYVFVTLGWHLWNRMVRVVLDAPPVYASLTRFPRRIQYIHIKQTARTKAENMFLCANSKLLWRLNETDKKRNDLLDERYCSDLRTTIFSFHAESAFRRWEQIVTKRNFFYYWNANVTRIYGGINIFSFF